ncbi:MAG TPA: hypothetical protein VLZ30_06300 [Verrucomicrobiae bacterium]|nr:hypothetical protein [Verrucomicrobiae bacterium]
MASANPIPEKLPLSRGQIVLRVLGGVLLSLCALMAVLGTTVLGKHLQGWQFLLYWSGCLLMTCAAIIIALWDMLLVRRVSKHSRRELYRQQFMSGEFAEKLRDHRNR